MTDGTAYDKLSKDQLSGVSCIHCGRVPVNLEVVDNSADTTLVACSEEDRMMCERKVFWLDAPCPPWCDGLHADHDDPDDRGHYSSWQGRVPLINEKAETCDDLLKGPFQPEYVALHIRQMVRENGAMIWCGLGETAKGWHLTPAEARTLAKVLMEAANLTSIAPKMAPSIKAA
ncbi:DUF6907 domain-containing protein [Actinosynnema sp. CS-041913]|uniref:DUF6907 domain-containing protein n=1 Tax=Actinosynnema sp. CS-041913 TaxID=3239917 RepID=UPI003D941C05